MARWSGLHRAVGRTARPHGGEVLNAATARTRAVAYADRAVARLAALGVDSDLDGAGLLDIRSSFTGWAPHDRSNSSGSARLCVTTDGWCAVNLPRVDDLELLPAWLGIDGDGGEVPWSSIEGALATRTTDTVVASAQELGLAVAAVVDAADDDEQLTFRATTAPARPWLLRRAGERTTRRSLEGACVVDLSSLWAGPSCARLLGLGGARVRKVESTSRPDGSRGGDPDFHRWLHDGHELLEFDFATSEGRARLVEFVHDADIVLEGSRPRALERLGIDPDTVLSRRPGMVWVSITGYGRCGPWRDRVAFGDDAAAAGGLIGFDGAEPSFVGDAIADPLAGVTAAALAVHAWQSGGGLLVDVGLREVARSAAAAATVVW